MLRVSLKWLWTEVPVRTNSFTTSQNNIKGPKRDPLWFNFAQNLRGCCWSKGAGPPVIRALICSCECMVSHWGNVRDRKWPLTTSLIISSSSLSAPTYAEFRSELRMPSVIIHNCGLPYFNTNRGAVNACWRHKALATCWSGPCSA